MTNAAFAIASQKFSCPDWTAKGDRRARVSLDSLRTLWINTGTLCNITCRNCYIESSPTNDALVYITRTEVNAYLDEIANDGWPVAEIGFTGGEPFMNPDMLGMMADALKRGFSVLVLTNAMQPMMRPKIRQGLLTLRMAYGDQLHLRISLDHHTQARHDEERGIGAFDCAVDGIDWLARHKFSIALAGRTCWGESENDARAGYDALINRRGWPVDAADKNALVLFPEMDAQADVPEITHACWDTLDLSPSDVMCASSRMVAKRRGDTHPTVLPCTLLTDVPAFNMGATLKQAARADGGMFDQGAVKLCHVHCARFCVLGGGACSRASNE